MMRLSTSDRFGALPTPARSSGTCPTPASIATRDGRAATSRPSTSTRPEQVRIPVMTCASSAWPLPATAATPTISPARTSSDASRRAGTPRSLSADTPSTPRTTRPGSTSVRLSASSTGRPTMSLARSARVTPRGSMPAAVTRPARITVIRSAIESTSPSLWLMNTTLRPSATIERRFSNSSAISCGARTAVGSSRISTRAPWNSSFTISTRCCSPTDSCHTRAPGSTRSPTCAASVADLLLGPAQVEPEPRQLQAEQHVLGHRLRRDEREVLVDHADARRDRVARRAEVDVPPVDPHLALRRVGTGRRARSSACSCPPRSHRAGHGSPRPEGRSRRGRWRAHRGTP